MQPDKPLTDLAPERDGGCVSPRKKPILLLRNVESAILAVLQPQFLPSRSFLHCTKSSLLAYRGFLMKANRSTSGRHLMEIVNSNAVEEINLSGV
jgi:hypothetical protein